MEHNLVIFTEDAPCIECGATDSAHLTTCALHGLYTAEGYPIPTQTKHNLSKGLTWGVVDPDFQKFMQSGEVRTTSSTGAEKGVKPQRYDLIPVGPMAKVAELYGNGAKKYDSHNWRKGYEWSKSYQAMQRHATQFWAGEDMDEEMGLPHLASVVFHALAMMEFMETHPEFDDRYKIAEAEEPPLTFERDYPEVIRAIRAYTTFYPDIAKFTGGMYLNVRPTADGGIELYIDARSTWVPLNHEVAGQWIWETDEGFDFMSNQELTATYQPTDNPQLFILKALVNDK